MRIKFSASLLFLLALVPSAYGQQPDRHPAKRTLTLASGETITATGSPSRIVFQLRHAHAAEKHVSIKRDATTAVGALPRLKLVAEFPGVALLTDTYPSHPGGLSFCQAGEEQFLRVLTLSGPVPTQTFELKLSSCRDTIELAEPGLDWSADERTLHIHWLTPPAGQPKDLTLTLTPEGQPLASTKAH